MPLRTKHFSQPIVAILILLMLCGACSSPVTPGILVFSKTAGFRHQSIEVGIETIKDIGAQEGYNVDATEDASLINEENLSNYHVVIFLNTTMDILNRQQQNDFERFIQAGGGFVGIHAAADTEYDWPWYNELVGAYFESHPNNPNVRTAEFYAVDKDHVSMDSIPDRFSVTDEFYSFKSIKSDMINVLLKVDESTYEGGTNGDDHPMSWYHEFDGGRAFYTAIGHTEEQFSNPLFLNHLKGGIEYALGGEEPVTLNYDQARSLRVPDENRFTKVVLDENLNEPVELAVLPDNRVLFIERRGAVKLYDPEGKSTKVIYELPVSHKYEIKDNGRDEAEDGLLGLAIDPNFSENGWLYMYHSLAGEKPVNVLTRWDFKDDQLVESSMKTILEVEVQRESCCHTGGSIAFDPKGNLYLSTGDNTSPRATSYAPLDEREGRGPWDAQKGSANTNDLRGKILRITPQDDGTYTIPEGNLFPEGTEKTRPEIFGMGMRNPYRISVDQKNGYVYWGDVGPDASKDSTGYGPMGYDEVNQARESGFFGWPYFIADNEAYHEYDFQTNTSGDRFDPEKPINNSPNNTGLEELPPAKPAFIYYPYGASKEFPLLGAGGRTSMAGPVYYKDMFANARRPFPAYYDGKLFIYEWMRGWIMAISMNEDGDITDMERFMPSYKFSNPMDMAFGPNGDLYLLEYGTGWFQQNENARLVRIEYNDGNRKPVVELAVSKQKGAIPHQVDFSTQGTFDYDRDALDYQWEITSAGGEKLATFSEPAPSYTFEKAGQYTATVTVTDSKGAKSTKEIDLVSGNEPPEVNLDIVEGNSSFFFPGKAFKYKASASDLEDGQIADDQLSVTVDFLKEGFDKIEIAQGHVAADENLRFAAGKMLISESDCQACHQVNEKSVGPMYLEVAKRYKDDPNAGDLLIKKIINGGSGEWGNIAMAAHPTLAVEDVGKMVSYILSLADEAGSTNLPAEGSYTVAAQDMVEGQGAVILRATYEDSGAKGMPSIKSQEVLTLQNPYLTSGTAVFDEDVNSMTFGGMSLKIGQSNGSMIGFEPFDFTDVSSIAFGVACPAQMGFEGGMMKLRLDRPDGKVVGTSAFIEPGPMGGNNPKVVVPIEATSGSHALYIEYVNEKNPGGSLFVIIDMTLQSE
ncbi:MAG: ThuA domain-containing protein [Marinoscillum sp.]